MNVEFEAKEFETYFEASQSFDADPYGDRIIYLNGKYYITDKTEADRLAASGVEFAYVHEHDLPDGTSRIITVPVN